MVSYGTYHSYEMFHIIIYQIQFQYQQYGTIPVI